MLWLLHVLAYIIDYIRLTASRVCTPGHGTVNDADTKQVLKKLIEEEERNDARSFYFIY